MDQNYFGTPFALTGDKTAIAVPLQTDGTISMTQGWTPDYALDPTTNPTAKDIDRATTNYLFYIITQMIAQYQQHGVPEWISPANNGGVAFAYAKHSYVRYSATTPGVAFETYVSAVDGNGSVPGADANWQLVSDFIATAAQATAGTDDRAIITPLKLAQQLATRALLAGNTGQDFAARNLTAAAKINGVNNPNLVFNGSGEFGNAGWAGLAPLSTQNDNSGGFGTFFSNTAAMVNVTAFPQSQRFPCGAGISLVMSADIGSPGVTAGTISVTMAAFDSSGTFISNFTSQNVTNGTGTQRYAATGTTPAGTATVSAEIAMTNVNAAAFGLDVRRIKVEAGNSPSLYSQEASIAASGQGRMLKETVLTASGTFVMQPTTKWVRVRLRGAGGPGGATAVTTSSQLCVGSGGGAGAESEAMWDAANVPASVAVTIAPGATSGANAATSSFGTLLTAPGGHAGPALFGSVTTPLIVSQGVPGGNGTATGTPLYSILANGQVSQSGVIISNGTVAAVASGQGAPGWEACGGGGGTVSGNGANAGGFGAGGGGAGAVPSSAAFVGGAGSGAICVIEEFS